MPYRPRALERLRGPEYLEARREPAERYLVPEGVRVLLAAVDVQSWGFEVLVVGYGERRERWIVDRFSLRKLGEQFLRPPAFVEHWSILTEKVIGATYRLPDERELRVRRVAIDSAGEAEKGGEVQVTKRAYEYWRLLRRLGHSARAWLVKGEGGKKAPVRKVHPDSSRRSDRKAASAGDVPVLLIGTDAVKDALWIDLERDSPGPGYLHIPDWIEPAALAELGGSEQREPKGWKQIAKRNETWDLLTYCDALWHYEGGERINWDRPPPWAAEWERNSEVITPEQRRALQARATPPAAGAQPPQPRPRHSIRWNK
jgi:phage terminase large subunit GpA-like protein